MCPEAKASGALVSIMIPFLDCSKKSLALRIGPLTLMVMELAGTKKCLVSVMTIQEQLCVQTDG